MSKAIRIHEPGGPEAMQWEEVEVFTHDDYDRIVEKGWKKFMYDFYPGFRGWDTEEYHTRINARAEKCSWPRRTHFVPRQQISSRCGPRGWGQRLWRTNQGQTPVPWSTMRSRLGELVGRTR